ncbi:MAG: HIT domain-containing protein [Candidatus Omnitrophica bacterium]|nr:HIT domain-containing protein [Candidatus Omnitrophota bacterium]MDD5670426.1 HIT domain-containing protein [Candidatus Omnitrophota bacterium]
MDRIWAPWRKSYIRPKKARERGCLFCRLRDAKNDRQNYVIKRTAYNFAVLNRYPYNNGHVMIVPKRHVAMLDELCDVEKLDWIELLEDMIAGLKRSLRPHGFNAGMNIGQVSGAGVPGHLHLHVVPRWSGDVNFMPIIGETKIISESLDSVYQALTRKPRCGVRKSVERNKR